MQNLPIILAVFVAAAAIIGILLWRLKPQAATNIDALDRRISEEVKRSETLQAKIDANEAMLRNALAGASAANATAEAAKAQAANADATLKQAKNDLALLQAKHNEVEPIVATATAQRKAAEDAREELIQRYTDLTTHNAALQNKVNLLSERATKAEKDAASANAEANATRERAEVAEVGLRDAASHLATLNVEASGTKSLLAEATTKHQAAEVAKDDLEQRHTTLLQKHTGLQADLVAVTGQASSAQTDLENRRLQIDGMSRTIEALQTNLLEERAKLNQALAKQQSNEDAVHQFKNISQTILKDVLGDAKRDIADLAATLKKGSDAELEKHAEKVAQTLEPLQAKLLAYDEAVESLKKGTLENYGSLREQLSELQKTERSLHDQAKALTTALSSSPKVKGNYGEMILKQLVEFVGMQEKYHFEPQASRETEAGRKIPDLVVSLPGGQKVLVDAKAVMDACVEAHQTQDDAHRSILLKKHCDNVRSRVVDLSSKNYFADHPNAVEAVVLFLPAENLYATAIENDAELTEFAMKRNIIICGPNSLMMLLKVANQLWRRASIEEEAQKIKDCGDSIYNAACLFIERYAKIGTRLQHLEEAYNEAAGTLNGNLIPKSRSMSRFTAVESSKEVEEISQLKVDIRPFSSPEAKKVLSAATEKLPGLSLGEFETAELTFVGDE